MSYVNVQEWSPENVADWLKGLDDAIIPYIHFFLNNNINGYHLLLLASEDLIQLHIQKVGHQELILEAVQLLNHLQYELVTENLQSLTMILACKARNVYNQLKHKNSSDKKVSTYTLEAVADILFAVKSVITWLDRSNFGDHKTNFRQRVLQLSVELALTAQRDQFADQPLEIIRSACLQLADLGDALIQTPPDSLILQPASLDLITVKNKPNEDLGVQLASVHPGGHYISIMKYQSPSYRSKKLDCGDEIVQVNYQTVVGWQLKKLLYALREGINEVHLTLKKRPKHSNLTGGVFVLKPYRIPSKKAAFNSSPSLHVSTATKPPPTREGGEDSSHVPTAKGQQPTPRPRHSLQRRATVSGASPTVTKAPVSLDQLLDGLRRKEIVGRSISHDPSPAMLGVPVNFTKPPESPNKKKFMKQQHLTVGDYRPPPSPTSPPAGVLNFPSQVMIVPDQPKVMVEELPNKDPEPNLEVSEVKTELSQYLSAASPPPSSPQATTKTKKISLSKLGRRISCKELGSGECQGWLFKRKEKRNLLSRWSKRWVVLTDHYMYCYGNKESLKAESLINVPGFTIKPAPECKSKKYAFKLFHSGTTFYFAAESQEEMEQWISTLMYSEASSENPYFSETEDEAESPQSSPSSSTSSSPVKRHSNIPVLKTPVPAARKSKGYIEDAYPKPQALSTTVTPYSSSTNPAFTNKPFIFFPPKKLLQKLGSPKLERKLMNKQMKKTKDYFLGTEKKNSFSPPPSRCAGCQTEDLQSEVDVKAPAQPFMGVTMLNKKRTSDTFKEEGYSDFKDESSDKDEIMLTVIENLWRSSLTIDGSDLRIRRDRTMYAPFQDRRISQLALSHRAFQRTLKDREQELQAINQLLGESDVTSYMLEQWAFKFPHYLPPDYC